MGWGLSSERGFTMAISRNSREKFDALLDGLISELPADLQQLLEEVPLIVEDEPGRALKDELDVSDGELCGLHWGTALTDRSVTAPWGMPDRMMLFRGPILRVAGYRRGQSDRALAEQIRITLLHEIGHHFGLDEDQLAALGYG
jgi:predicted Zn-dependent protease with MMP-like domain